MAEQEWSGRPPAIYFWLETLSGTIIVFMILFAPWAFGTTEDWSMNIMDGAGYFLGLALLAKRIYRWRTGFRPARWEERACSPGVAVAGGTRVLAGLTVAIVVYCFISAVNARAIYIPADWRFEYRDCVRWLPHSYDQRASWRAFFNYAALACYFWGLRDWILGQTEEERRRETSQGGRVERRRRSDEGGFLGRRLRIILWILCLNGTFVAAEALLQWADGTTKLLWLVETHINRRSDDHLGPYAYRGNGVQYLNLVWPMAVGLWWSGWRNGSRKARAVYNMLLPCAVLMAGAVLFSLSRAGAFVCVGGIIVTTMLLLCSLKAGWISKATGILVGILALGVAVKLISGNLEHRFKTTSLEESRLPMFRVGWRMAKDFPIFGSGPNSLNAVYQLYRGSADEYWPGQLHNDWLETFITFGGIGTLLILGALGVVLGRWFSGEGIAMGRTTVAFFWMSLGGCLTHALVDFPLQIYSVLSVVLTVCAILFSVSRKPQARTS